MSKTNPSEKVLVGMSGGVDSSVTAALLKRAGFDVIGGFMKLWKPNDDKSVSEDEERVREIAHKLGISFYDFDFRREFKRRVVDYFFKEYREGRTPNPCVVCNNKIKFGLFLEKALALNVDYVATGHYARLERNSRVKVHRTGGEKDQTYFLWQLGQEQLEKVLFPLGRYEKKEVKKLAGDFNLPVQFTESHEVCFVPDETDEFLKEYLPTEPGEIVTSTGKKLGEHQGVHFFTLGQRKGLGLSQGPWYVLKKDVKNGKLVVTEERKKLKKRELTAKEANWITDEPSFPLEIEAKIRYNSPAKKAMLKKKSNGLKVFFKKPRWAIAPGQSVVFYSDGQLLGGGIIQ